MRALSINLCGAAELRSCGAAELRRYPYDGTAGTHRKRLVNFRNILAISLCAPIVDTSDIRYTFSEFLTRGDTAFVHVFEFVRIRPTPARTVKRTTTDRSHR